MILSFQNDTIKESYENFDFCNKNYGTKIAHRIIQRLGELQAAENMMEFITAIPAIKIEEVKNETLFLYTVNLIDNTKLLIKLKQKLQPNLANHDSILDIEIVDILN